MGGLEDSGAVEVAEREGVFFDGLGAVQAYVVARDELGEAYFDISDGF